MKDLITIRRLVELAWNIHTTYTPSNEWSPSNPAQGQCKITAVKVWRELGGNVMVGNVNGVGHAWNRINGIDVDLTWSQFPPGSEVKDIREATGGEELITEPWMKDCYRIFDSRYNELLRQ